MHRKYSALALRSFLVLASAMAALSLPVSCTRGARTKPAAKPVASAAPAAAVASPQAKPAQAPAATRPAPAPAPRLPSAPMAASMRAFGLRADSVPRIARDFSLGPLQSYRPAEGDEAAAFEIARSFAEGIAAGKLDREILLPEARDALSVLLEPPVPGSGTPAAISYRLGAIELKGSGGSLRLRLPGPGGADRKEGLLSLRKAGDKWYVEAFALDPPASGALAFNPDSSSGAEGRPR